MPFLYNAFGIEMAAQTYFDKSADQLDVLESATLIGMLKGTSAYNPVLNPERARQRRNLVLTQMARHGKLDPAQVAALSRRPLKLDFERQVEPLGAAPHLAQHLRKWLIAWADRNDFDIHADGLVVRTTLDAKLQKAANQAVARKLNQLQALAAGSARPPGHQACCPGRLPCAGSTEMVFVRAWVGSRDFAQEQFDHVSQARRQPGSTFKPFVYGAAFLMGLSPSCADRPAGGDPPAAARSGCRPTRASYGRADGPCATAWCIRRTTYQPAADAAGGRARVAAAARSMGVRQRKLELVPSLALGPAR